MLWTRVDGNVRKLVERLAESQGITISEYVRRLIIEDLDKRSIFTAILKHEVAKTINKKPLNGEAFRGSKNEGDSFQF